MIYENYNCSLNKTCVIGQTW